MTKPAPKPRFWSVRIYGLDGNPFDPIVERPTASAARYAAFKAAREAGYFPGRDGFLRFLVNVRTWPSTETEIQLAPRIEHPSPKDHPDA